MNGGSQQRHLKNNRIFALIKDLVRFGLENNMAKDIFIDINQDIFKRSKSKRQPF